MNETNVTKIPQKTTWKTKNTREQKEPTNHDSAKDDLKDEEHNKKKTKAPLRLFPPNEEHDNKTKSSPNITRRISFTRDATETELHIYENSFHVHRKQNYDSGHHPFVEVKVKQYINTER